jgi:hypothetical protein
MTEQVPNVVAAVPPVDPAALVLCQLLKDLFRGICASVVQRLDAAPNFIQGPVDYAAVMRTHDSGAEYAMNSARAFAAFVNYVCPHLSLDGKRKVLSVIDKDLAPFAW